MLDPVIQRQRDDEVELADADPAGCSAVLWDFTDKNYSLGWKGGGGVVTLRTEPDVLVSAEKGGYARVLSASMPASESGAAGIVHSEFREPLDLSAVDALVFELAAIAENAGAVSGYNSAALIFMVRTEDGYRAEFADWDVPCGEPIRLRCDLSEWPHRSSVKSVAVTIYADFDVSLKLARISAESASLSEDGIREVFFPAPAEEPAPPGDRISAWLTVGFVLAGSFVAFVLITRREHDHGEL